MPAQPQTWLHHLCENDHIGRWFAILCFAPLLVYKGVLFRDVLLVLFGVLLFVWDSFWIVTDS